MYDVKGSQITFMGRPKTYTINEEYFNTPLTERKAYLLGLILSDGHLNYQRGCFQYACKKDDVELIYFIKEELGSSHPIKEYKVKRKFYVRYNVTNKKLVTSLIDAFNLPKLNKSQNNLSIPKKIPADLIPHFLRGMFDGDGSIWRHKNDSFCFSYTGGYNMMKEIKKTITDSVNISLSPIRFRYGKNNKNSCSVGTKGTLKVSMFGDFIYKDSSCFLKRKREKFDMCKCLAEKTRLYRYDLNGNEQKIKRLYLNGIIQKEIASQLNLVYSSVRCCVQRLRKSDEID